MPLIDSFKVDHDLLSEQVPCVRPAKSLKCGDAKVHVFDLRFCKPNETSMSPAGIHTLEHLFAGFMRRWLGISSQQMLNALDVYRSENPDVETYQYSKFEEDTKEFLDYPIEVVDISPMGCRTGFYMSVLTESDKPEVIAGLIAGAWKLSMKSIIGAELSDIGELNVLQCGTFEMHSLLQAKSIAHWFDGVQISVCDNQSILLSDSQLDQLEADAAVNAEKAMKFDFDPAIDKSSPEKTMATIVLNSPNILPDSDETKLLYEVAKQVVAN